MNALEFVSANPVACIAALTVVLVFVDVQIGNLHRVRLARLRLEKERDDRAFELATAKKDDQK